MIKAIIVEDEASLRTLINNFVTEVGSDIEIVAECENINEAKLAIVNHKPDIVFLDIVLPGGTSLDLLEQMPDLKSEIIFVTAYDKYLLDAFKYSAVGYVLKPIDKEQLKIAIDNAKKRITEKGNNNVDALLGYIKQKVDNDSKHTVGIPTQDGIIFLDYSDIVQCEGQRSCTKIHLKDNTEIVSSYNLGEFRRILPEDFFFQIHKSHIISIAAVRKYNSKEGIVEMQNGENIPISKASKKDFINHFKIPKR